MKKIHTRQKRRLGICTHKRHYAMFHTVKKEHRPRTFASADAAKAWAKENGITAFDIEPAKKNKRFKVIVSG